MYNEVKNKTLRITYSVQGFSYGSCIHRQFKEFISLAKFDCKTKNDLKKPLDNKE